MLQLLLKEHPPLPRLAGKTWYPWLVVSTVCVGAFLGQLDTSIVSLVLPTLQQDFHTPLSNVQWVAIIYLLVLTSLITPLGRVADQMGRKALYTLGFIIFILGSAFCGLAPSLLLLVLARAVQGIGAALLQANSVAIITAAMPREKLGRGIGVQATAQALGLALGPTLGGFLIAYFSWRWIFLLNIPVGLAGAVLARLALPQTQRHQAIQPFNRQGSVLLPAAIATFLLALTFLNIAWYVLPATVLLLAGFIISERRSPVPLLGPEILRAPGFMAGIAAALLSYTVLFGGLFAVPLLLERVYDAAPDTAGLMLTTVPLMLTAMAQVGGHLSDRLGARVPTVLGMLLASVGLIILWTAGGAHRLVLITGLVFLGLGAGLFIPSNNASVMAAAPRSHLGAAGGLLNMMRGLGASFGVALVGVMLAIYGAGGHQPAGQGQVLAGIRLTFISLLLCAVITGALSWQRPAQRAAAIRRDDDLL